MMMTLMMMMMMKTMIRISQARSAQGTKKTVNTVLSAHETSPRLLK